MLCCFGVARGPEREGERESGRERERESDGGEGERKRDEKEREKGRARKREREREKEAARRETRDSEERRKLHSVWSPQGLYRPSSNPGASDWLSGLTPPLRILSCEP